MRARGVPRRDHGGRPWRLPGRGRIRVGPMRPRDVPAVHRIETAVHARPWSATLLRQELGQVDRSYLVARRGRRVVGYAGAQVVVGEAHVLTLAVAPDARRRGVATHLLVELLAAAHRLGATAVTLEVRESNEAARALYRRFGFEVEGLRPRYYGDNGEAAAIMWLRDLDGLAARDRLRDEAARIRRSVPTPFATP
jgi:ribosomal-protein-alanine N-acetyltransferase